MGSLRHDEARLTQAPDAIQMKDDSKDGGVSGARRTWFAGPLTPLGLTVAAICLLLDQASKLWLLFVYDLGSRGRVPVAPFVDFVLYWNTGISYGLFAQESALGRWLLVGFMLAAVVLLWIWLARSEHRLAAVALGLIIGGALGNAIDRVLYGAVADFVLIHIDFGTWQFHWYVFNVADAAIVAGVIGLIYETLFMQSAAKAP